MRHTVVLIRGAWSRNALIEQGTRRLSEILGQRVQPEDIHVEFIYDDERAECRVSIDIPETAMEREDPARWHVRNCPECQAGYAKGILGSMCSEYDRIMHENAPRYGIESAYKHAPHK